MKVAVIGSRGTKFVIDNCEKNGVEVRVYSVCNKKADENICSQI